MSRSSLPRPFTRRAFLRSAVAAAAVTVASQVVTSSTQTLVHRLPVPLRLGVLLPQTPRYPALAQQFHAGLHVARFHPARHTIEAQPIPYTSPGAAVQAAQALLTSNQVDALVGVVSPEAVNRLDPLLAQHAIPLVVTDVGASVMQRPEQRPYVFRNALNHWQSSVALGQWAARHAGQRAVLIGTYYDLGYDTLAAFSTGFTSAGGTVLETLLTDLPAGGVSFAALPDYIRAAQPDVLYLAASGPEAGPLVRIATATNLPVFVSSFLAETTAAPVPGGVLSALSWADGLPDAEPFVHTFTHQHRYAPDAFAALGYDTGLLLQAAAAQADLREPGALVRALDSAHSVGARGPIAFDPLTGISTSPLYLRTLATDGGKITQQFYATLPAPEPAVIAPLLARPFSGWINAYLSI